MPDGFYSELIKDANDLIGEFGKPATLIREERSGPLHDPTIVARPFPVMIVETGYKLDRKTDSQVQMGDKLGIIRVEGTEGFGGPLLTDKIEIGGSTYTFVDIQPLEPGPVLMLWEFLARK